MADRPQGVPVDLRADGVLWLVNRAVFHPRGYALSYTAETGEFRLLGPGTEPWHYEGIDEDGLFAAVEALLTRARDDG